MSASTDRPTSALVTGFARDFNATHLAEHAVGSPLGLWLLLALLAPAATGSARADLERVLRTDAQDAATRAGELLDTAHPAVTSAVAVWANELALDGASFTSWAQSLPTSAQHGPIPTQADANQWASTHTRDLIKSFPLALTPATAMVLASALATKVTWTAPFDDVPGADLGGLFGAQVATALGSRDDGPHQQFLAHTEAAGLVGALVARSADGLVVTSVIADPNVAPGDVHEAAHQVAALVHGDSTNARRVSLFDVPLGAGHAWDIREVVVERFGGSRVSEVIDAVLPAWSLTSRHDLSAAAGVQAAFEVMETFLAPELRPATFEAVQSAVAAFSRDGFEAAALTAMAMRAASVPQRVEVRERSATIRFNRPFAVVASAASRARNVARGWGEIDLGVPAWAGVPVFSAWIGKVD